MGLRCCSKRTRLSLSCLLAVATVGVPSAGAAGVTAIGVSNFLNSIGACTHIAQGVDNAPKVATCLTYAGIRNIRDDGSKNAGTIQAWIGVHTASMARVMMRRGRWMTM